MYILRYMGSSGTSYYWNGRDRWVDSKAAAHRYRYSKYARRALRRDTPYHTGWFVPFDGIVIEEIGELE